MCVLSRVRLCHSMDCSPPGSFVHGISQARILEWIAISSSGGSSQSRDWTHVFCVSCIAGRFFTLWAIWETFQEIEEMANIETTTLDCQNDQQEGTNW